MKKRTHYLIYTFTIIGLFLLLSNGCKKDETSQPNSGLIFNPNLIYGTVTDIDGNVYKTIQIGTQTWMAENLKVTHYRNGTSIPNVTDSVAWYNLTTGAYCNYENNPNISTTYGKLYNWYAVKDSNNIAPLGWHVPSDNEWTILTDYLGGENLAGGKLKEIGITHWADSNRNATNESGFTAIPAGYHYDYNFEKIGIWARWWSSTDYSIDFAYGRVINEYGTVSINNGGYKPNGYSVRCIKDK
jgi:uncharacterized protein (TIGR02145 family)